MEIHPLTPGRAPDFFEFFDHRAFTDNPDWKGCYCTFFHRPEAGFQRTRREQAQVMIASGALQGCLAYDDEGRVLGWCNANRKSAYAKLAAHETDVLAVVCFVIDPKHRRRGIARALLARVVEEARQKGFRAVEAYPSARARTEGGHYHGPLALGEALGFTRMPGRKLVVRLDLSAPPA